MREHEEDVAVALDALWGADVGDVGIFDDISLERESQVRKWGDQHHPDGTGHPWYRKMADNSKAVNDARSEKGNPLWSHILLEEVYEALSEKTPASLRDELIQVAAVCAAWVQDIDSRDTSSL